MAPLEKNLQMKLRSQSRKEDHSVTNSSTTTLTKPKLNRGIEKTCKKARRCTLLMLTIEAIDFLTSKNASGKELPRSYQKRYMLRGVRVNNEDSSLGDHSGSLKRSTGLSTPNQASNDFENTATLSDWDLSEHWDLNEHEPIKFMDILKDPYVAKILATPKNDWDLNEPIKFMDILNDPYVAQVLATPKNDWDFNEPLKFMDILKDPYVAKILAEKSRVKTEGW